MSKIDRSNLFLALNEDNEMYRAGYHSGMAHGIMIDPKFYNDPLAWTTEAGTYVKACGGEFTVTNSKGQDTPVERKYSDTALCKNCAKLAETLGEAARQAKWDNSYEKVEAMGEVAAAQREVEESAKAADDAVAMIFEQELGIDGEPWNPGDNPARRKPEEAAVENLPLILPTMLTVKSPGQIDGPSVEVVKVEAKPKEGAKLPGEGSQKSRETKRAPFKASTPKVHKPLSEPKLFGEANGAVHTEDRQNPAADDFASGAQAGTYRGHTSLTSGADMTGAMPKERKEGGKPVRTTLDRPLGRERLDVSASVDKKIVQTADGVKVALDRVGGKFGTKTQAEYNKLSRSGQRRYWRDVKKARQAHADAVKAAKAAKPAQ